MFNFLFLNGILCKIHPRPRGSMHIVSNESKTILTEWWQGFKKTTETIKRKNSKL